MKKICLLLGMLLAVNNAAMAACEYECVAPYNLNNKFVTFMSAVTGVNSINEKWVESALKKEVLKTVSSENLEVDIDSYSPVDLGRGIFKSAHIKGNDVIVNDVHLDSLDLKTLCDFNYINKSGGNISFVENMPMSFDITMTQDSINKTMKHGRYQKVISDLNKIGASYGGGLQISSTNVAIKSNKFYYIVGFNVPFLRHEQKMVLQADLHVKNGKLDFSNTKLVSGKVRLDLKKADFILNYLNPLDFSVNIYGNHNAKVMVKNAEIKNNVIVTDGVVILQKD